MDIRVNKALSYVDGQLSDGRPVEVSTVDDAPRHDSETRTRATHEWLHGTVLVLIEGDAPPRVVVPVHHISDAVVGEALRRWLVLAA
ncbi:hypothetical protein [uncultured Nocardioides sp.]|uniref:hypothetical protein n=1 Tax=uncultured Nocardioides sp. TaxID=198441 RepID=UPI0025DC367C|nr:hypothetical protein [uncultured Nocardioides sp.]